MVKGWLCQNYIMLMSWPKCAVQYTLKEIAELFSAETASVIIPLPTIHNMS